MADEKSEECVECPWDLKLSEEEQLAFHRLRVSLDNGANTSHEQAETARLANLAIEKILAHLVKQHDWIHDQDTEIREAEKIMIAVVGKRNSMGVVEDKKDMN